MISGAQGFLLGSYLVPTRFLVAPMRCLVHLEIESYNCKLVHQTKCGSHM